MYHATTVLISENKEARVLSNLDLWIAVEQKPQKSWHDLATFGSIRYRSNIFLFLKQILLGFW